ncbi:hypothetical protein K8I28_12315 [bacterium]|nr:hypothetical protein [bacterium]
MYRIISLSLLLIISNITLNVYALDLMEELKSDVGWEVSDMSDDGQILSTRSVEGLDGKCVKIARTVNVSSEQISQIVYDIANYNSFITTDRVFADMIYEAEDYKDGYQRYDVPFLKDRHLIYRMSKPVVSNDSTLIKWELLPEDNQYRSYLVNLNPDSEPIYATEGAGLWEIVKLTENTTEVSYSLYMNPGGMLPDFLINKANRNGIAGLFNDVLNAAEKVSVAAGEEK